MTSALPTQNRPDFYHKTAHFLFYDGDCGLCHRVCQFVLARDKHSKFMFAPIQGKVAQLYLHELVEDVSLLDTVYVLVNESHQSEKKEPSKKHEKKILYRKSKAIFFTLGELGGVYTFARLLFYLPSPMFDWAYDLVAAFRYRVFGSHKTCRAVLPEQKKRFLDD